VTLTLHLGVVDIGYADASGKTTSDVAQILEDKYHIMEVFAEDIGLDVIQKAIEHSAQSAVETLILGVSRPGSNSANMSLTLEAEGEIEAAFKLWLSQQSMDYTQPGVPTQAALKGVSHRLKRANAKTNSARPSFIDTGLYQSSMRAWIEG
jgi:hypothetical protein